MRCVSVVEWCEYSADMVDNRLNRDNCFFAVGGHDTMIILLILLCACPCFVTVNLTCLSCGSNRLLALLWKFRVDFSLIPFTLGRFQSSATWILLEWIY